MTKRRHFIKTGALLLPTLLLPRKAHASGFGYFGPLHPQTVAWLQTIRGTQQSDVAPGTVMAANRYVGTIKAAGLVGKFFHHNLYVGRNLAAMAVCILPKPIILTLTGFVEGDFTEATGLIGGSGKYINFPAPNTFTTPGFHMGCYVRTASDEATVCMGGQHPGTCDAALYVSYSGTTYWDAYNTTTGRCSFADSSGTGLYIGNRSLSAGKVYKNGVERASTSGASGNACDSSIDVHGLVDSGSGHIQPTSRRLALLTFGESLTGTEITALYNAGQALHTELGRQV